MKYRTFTFTDDIYSWLSPKPKGVEVDTALIKTILESNKPCRFQGLVVRNSRPCYTASSIRFRCPSRSAYSITFNMRLVFFLSRSRI